MESEKLGLCPACGRQLEVIYYQRRAADEPPDSVTYCPLCPLDPSKLSLTMVPSPSKVYKSENSRKYNHKRLNTSISRGIIKFRNILCISVEGKAAHRCREACISKGLQKSATTGIAVPLMNSDRKEILEISTSSTFENEAHLITSSNYIAPYTSLLKVEVYKCLNRESRIEKELMTGYSTIIPHISRTELSILETLPDGSMPKIYVIIKECNNNFDYKDEIVLDVLNELLVIYGSELSVKSFISSSVLSSLYTQSSKAYDWPSAPEKGYKYTWKPDGERFWYIKYGSIWFFSRRLLSGFISGWNINNTLDFAIKAGPVLDVEVMIGHDPILIDVLVLPSGEPTPPSRSLRYVLDTFYGMENIGVSIHVRKYFENTESLMETKDTIDYPIDGIVGIQDGSMTIIKLKTIKSIELELLDDGSLVSAEKTPIATSDLCKTYDPGSIIELRIKQDASDQTICVDEVILRTDKSKANSYEVCRNIYETMASIPDDFERRRALIWCNSIRNRLHRIAASITARGRIVVDIGAGDGQSASDYSTDKNVSYLLLEPDLARCRKLFTRLKGMGMARFYENAGYLSKAMSALTVGTLKYGIINCTFSDVISQENSIRIFRESVKCFVSSFSISHVYSDLMKISAAGFEIVGCGYLYDDMDKDGYIVNNFGVVMRKVDEKIAIVRWGSDKEFTEFPIIRNTLSKFIHINSATKLIPIFGEDNEGLLSIIASKLFIVSTRKHL